MVGHGAQPFVEHFTEVGNSVGVFRYLFLAPAIGNCSQQCDQGGGGGQDNPLTYSVFDEFRIEFQSGAE